MRPLSDREFGFERERLLNLIDSRVERKEIDIARSLAEELFRIEVGISLRRKTRALKKYNALLLRIMSFLISVVFISFLLTVLNINPVLSLLVEGGAVVLTLFAILINALLAKHFEKAIETILNMDDSLKEASVERLLNSFPGRTKEQGGDTYVLFHGG